ncbi:5-aminoimidazole-4-carboxamide ribonucleotide transformylase [Nocardia sp. ET3-3]|uniref:5-aminoimidazole-4-carboxamide ribonucleotide transformylase n=1 Tax=Nocardia terrae TaxID=2675851 RepID=A0A7K1V590_9NOCA|nr:5-aminoimidazole-4-carboxamide ribonucleotide transformylase [Nocardia terrae]MVU81651.1 5-aminoimidazole-4-carboxamide ribonucleotide transformylase [Nocardia terrae]
MTLRYGMNPHQSARVAAGGDHLRVLHGSASMINYLDALNAWQLVAEASRATGKASAASFKHVSPAGAALDGELDETMRASWRLGDGPVGPVTAAYARARDADPRSSYGDMIAVSEPVDHELADLLSGVVSDGIIAPGYAPGTVAALGRKKGGRFLVLEIDPAFRPPVLESRTVFGITLEQDRDSLPISADLLRVADGEALGECATVDALLGLITARYTQSNTVVFVRDGMTIGVGAGQQSRIDCTVLAGSKARTWWARRHSDAPSGITLVSDGYLPFRDNVDAAAELGVETIVEPGGSLRSEEVAAACREHGITLARTGVRLFHH